MSTTRWLWSSLGALLVVGFSVLLWMGSAEFMGKPIIHLLVWMRVPGDTVFSVGAGPITWFVFRLWIAPRRAVVTAVIPAAAGPIAEKPA